MINQQFIRLIYLVIFIFVSTNSYAMLGIYSVDKNAAQEAKVHTEFDKNEGANAVSYGYDPYGSYLSAFPSMNDNGDIAGRSAYTYIHPNSGNEITQWESSVWINGVIQRFGVVNCSTANCQSRALKISNSRNFIIGSSHAGVAGTTQYFERSMKWHSETGNWNTAFAGFDNVVQGYAEDINNQNNYVGSALITLDYVRHAQAMINGTKYTIGAYNTQSLGVAINNNNDIIGTIQMAGIEKAFMWNEFVNTDSPIILPSLSNGRSIAYDINDDSFVVGTSINANNMLRAVMWYSPNTIVDLGTLGGDKSEARSINNIGTVVGYSETTSGEKHAFIYFENVMFDLNDYTPADSAWVIVDAYTVNESGQILVRAQRNNSLKIEDNAYWVLSPHDYFPQAQPAMIAGNGYCQWGKVNCEVTYPPTMSPNGIYQLPVGSIPVFPEAQVPSADMYVCNTSCENYSNLLPQTSTINEAINLTSGGNTIVVLPGTYYETISLFNRKLIGLSKEYTVVNATGTSTRPLRLQGVTFVQNIAFTGGSALDGGGIQVSGGGNTIDNCIIQGNVATRDGGGIHGLMYSEFTLTNSIVSQNKSSYGGGFISWGYGSANVEHNKFLNNNAKYGAGAFFGAYSTVFFNANIVDGNTASFDGGGIYVNNYTNDRSIRNSIITNNYANSYGGGVNSGSLLGSVVYGNTAGIVSYSAIFKTVATNSIIWGNAGNYAANGIYDSIYEVATYCTTCNVIILDPMFVDPVNGDFRLLSGSPAIDSGIDTSSIFSSEQTDDFNGVMRGIDGDLQGILGKSDYDIGAFEYIPN